MSDYGSFEQLVGRFLVCENQILFTFSEDNQLQLPILLISAWHFESEI